MTRMTLDTQGKRRLMIGIALVVTLVAAWFAPEDDSSGARVDLAAPRAAPAGEQAAGSSGQTAEERRAALAALDVDLIRKRDAGVAGDDAFARKSWYVPPPPPPPPKPLPAAPVVEAPPPPPPPPPMAPPLPFKHLGRLVEAGQALPKHYLMDGDRMIVVSEGDLISGKYRFVGQIGNQLQFIYLPLNQRQNLPMSGAQ